MSPPSDDMPGEAGSTPRPTVTVCLPVSRSSALTARALGSVLNQELDDIEVLVGDETGESKTAVDAIGDRRVSYHRNPHRLGFTGNHVALLDRAKGRYSRSCTTTTGGSRPTSPRSPPSWTRIPQSALPFAT